MLRTFIEIRKDFSRFLRNDSCLVILSGEFADWHSIESKSMYRDEFNFTVRVAAQELNIFEAAHLAVMDTDKNLLFRRDSYLFALLGIVHPCQILAIIYRLPAFK